MSSADMWARVRKERRRAALVAAARFTRFTVRNVWEAMDRPNIFKLGRGWTFSSIQGDCESFVEDGLARVVVPGKPGVARIYEWRE